MWVQVLLVWVFLVMVSAVSAQDSGKGPVLVAEGLEFPEGPAWDGRGHVYVSNCHADYITRINLDGKVVRRWMTASGGDEPFTFQKTNGMRFYRDGSLFVCDFGRKAIIRVVPETGECQLYADKCDGEPFRGPNDLAFDPEGNLYFTDPTGSNENKPVGAVYRVEQGSRKVTRVAEGLAFPNGIAFSADAQTLFVAESNHNRILKYPVQADGRLGQVQVFAELAKYGSGDPDGIALDERGRLWITHYNNHRVIVLNRRGNLSRVILLSHTSPAGPTNITFAGDDLRTVCITDPGNGGVWRMRSEVPGLRLFSFPD